MDRKRHQPLHLSEDERQVASHVCFRAKLPAKWKVTDYSIHAGTGQRQRCTHRRIQKCHSVNKYIAACTMFTCNKIATGMCLIFSSGHFGTCFLLIDEAFSRFSLLSSSANSMFSLAFCSCPSSMSIPRKRAA